MSAALDRIDAAIREHADRCFRTAIYGQSTATGIDPTDTILTIEKMRAALRALERRAPPADMITEIVVTSQAVKQGDRLFPASRHRSARIRKKLIRRFGGEFKRIPCTMRAGTVLITHPAIAEQVIAATKPKVAEPWPNLWPSLSSIPVRWLR